MRTNLTEDQAVSAFGLLILAGCILFAWFFWPLIFKGMINAGNLSGMAVSSMLIFYGARHQAVHRSISRMWQNQTGRVCLIILAVLAAAGTVLMTAAAVAVLGAVSKTIPDNTPAIVLGCSVKGTAPSRVLQERIDAACVYLQQHPDAVCILSGGQGRDEDISEAACMYREMLAAGMDASRLYQESESVNTQENLENSKKILEKLGISETVTIISSEFHLYRGRYWAEKLGYQTYGCGAHTDWKYLPSFFLREIIAVVHLWLTEFPGC